MLTFCQIFFNWKIRRKILILLIFIIIIGGCRENTPTPIPAEIPSPISTAIPGNSYAPADSPWPMFAHDPAHRGYTKNLGPVKGNLKWFFKTDGEIHSSPVIGSDEVIYTGSDDSYLYAIKPEGNLKWKFKTGGKIRSTPLIIQKGSIYIHSFDGYFYSINSDGKEEWKFKTGKNISLSLPVISEEGIIYINSSGYFYAISPKGKEIWKIKIKYKDASAVIGQDGTVYLSDYGIHALNSKGITKWYRKEENPTSPSSLGKGDTNYLGIWGEENNAFMAIAGNKKKFLVPVEGKMTGSPSISRDGNIYTGCYDGKIYSFDQKGNINWSFQTGDIIRSSPVIDGEGNIYTGSYDRYLYAINKKGKLLWKFKCHEAIEGSPSIGEDETLYFTSLDGNIYSLHSGEETVQFTPIPDSPSKGVSGTLYGQNSHRNSQSSYEGPLVPNIKWFLRLGDVGVTPPVITKEGNIYIGTGERDEEGKIYALTSEGKIRWIFDKIGRTEYSDPVAGQDGTIYFTTWDQRIIALREEGILKWAFQGDDSFKYSPSIDKKGFIYASSGHQIYCLTQKGTLKWKAVLDDLICSKPLLDIQGTIYQLTGDGYLFTISEQGKIKKKQKICTNASYGEADSKGNIYITGRDGLYLIKKDNKKLKLYSLSEKETIEVPPVILSNDDINIITQKYITTREGTSLESKLMCLNEKGILKWNFKIEGTVKSPPITDSYGNIYLATQKGEVIALNYRGSEIWRHKTRGYVLNSPCLDSNGNLFIVYSVINLKNLKAVESGIEKISSYGKGKNFFKFLDWHNQTSPVITAEGNIYVISGTNNLYAVNPDGSKKWVISLSSPAKGNPATNRKEDIFLGCDDGTLKAYNKEGKLLWRYKTQGSIESSPLIDEKGLIYTGSNDGYLYCFTTEGNKKWSFYIGTPLKSSPAIKKDIIYITSQSGYIYAIDRGKLNWKLNTESITSPCISEEGIIYSISRKGDLIAIDSSKGERLWSYILKDKTQNNPSFDEYSKSVYTACNNGILYALKSKGQLKWTFKADSAIKTSPLLDNKGNIYFSSIEGKIYALNSYGIKKWVLDIKSPVTSSLNLSPEGILYITSKAGFLYASGE